MNIFNPEVVVIGGGVIAAGELLLEPARARSRRARCRPSRGRASGSSPPQFGVEAGMIGAAALAFDGLAPSGRAAGVSGGRLIVCPTPIGNLEDVTLRVLAALREADVVACEDTRRTRVLLDRYGVSADARLLPRAQRARARAPSWSQRMRDGRGRRAGLRRRHAAGVRSRASCSCARCVAAGLAVEVLPGPSAALAALVASGAAGRPLALRRASCRASAASCWSVFGVARDARGVRVAAARRRRRWRVLAELDPERPVAVCRELTKLHEEVVRGTRGRAGGALRGRAAARRGRARDRRRAAGDGAAATSARRCRRAAPPGRRRRAGRARRPRVVAELTGVGANALYRALTARPRDDARACRSPATRAPVA